MRKSSKKNNKGLSILAFILIIIIIGFSAYTGIFGLTIANTYHLKSFNETIKMGLDLTGGVSVIEEVQGSKVDNDTINRTIDLLNMRINAVGVSETTIAKYAENKIKIDVPGVYDTKSVIENVAKSGKLEFKDPSNNVILSGSDVHDAQFAYDQNNQPIVSLTLKDSGKTKFADATEKFMNQKISIYMDDTLVCSPTVQAHITDGKAQISTSSLDEAKSIANKIQSGALPVTLKTASASTVSASLGSKALPQSMMAGAIGIGLVLLFMLILYRIPGLMADIALALYTILVLVVYSVIGARLTLAGIAAFLLTVGMAVDANVLMFERIKEELKKGKSVSSALDNGYHKALSSILDSNITTIITGLVLYFIGTGSVKGFAITLLIGICVSLFTALVVTKVLLRLALNIGFLKKASYFGVREVKTNA
ncbi:MAG: protein translocase subunit SecD [Bacillota bacterium]|nr:protein translocase subunit SecD [Bacillota bacterium]